jgi:hypothetical protein
LNKQLHSINTSSLGVRYGTNSKLTEKKIELVRAQDVDGSVAMTSAKTNGHKMNLKGVDYKDMDWIQLA